MTVIFESILLPVRRAIPLILAAVTSVVTGGCSPRPLTPLDTVFADVVTNEIAALDTYKRESIRFKAVVHSTGLTNQSEVRASYVGGTVLARESVRQVPYARLLSESPNSGSVVCHFSGSSDVAMLRPGDHVVVEGRVYWVQGQAPVQVVMSRCKVVKE